MDNKSRNTYNNNRIRLKVLDTLTYAIIENSNPANIIKFVNNTKILDILLLNAVLTSCDIVLLTGSTGIE